MNERECHKRAPAALAAPGPTAGTVNLITFWPHVAPQQRCGDFKRREDVEELTAGGVAEQKPYLQTMDEDQEEEE